MRYESLPPDGILGPFTDVSRYEYVRFVDNTGHWIDVGRASASPDLVLVVQDDDHPSVWLDASVRFTWDPGAHRITVALKS